MRDPILWCVLVHRSTALCSLLLTPARCRPSAQPRHAGAIRPALCRRSMAFRGGTRCDKTVSNRPWVDPAASPDVRSQSLARAASSSRAPGRRVLGNQNVAVSPLYFLAGTGCGTVPE
jgi:hypothetical protein